MATQTITIEDFMKKATKEQKELLFSMSELAEQEKKVADTIEKKVAPHRRNAENANELIDGQYAGIIRQDAQEYAVLATVNERKELNGIREKMKELMIKAVKNYNMGTVGIIQRNYKHYVGKPMPQ